MLMRRLNVTPICLGSPYIPVIINRTECTTVSNRARTVKFNKTRQLIINWFRCSLHTKPMKTKTKHYDIVDLEPTSFGSVEETMIVLSVVNIN